MGNGASVETMQQGISEKNADLREFVSNFASLAVPGAQAKAVRKQTWLAVDPNGNGLVSLAEFDGWIKKTLLLNATSPEESAEADRLWKLYRPSYIRAFNDAKDVSKEREIKSVGDAYTTGKIALVVAGYDVSDTVNAAKYLRTQKVDTSAGKAYVGTTSTSAELMVDN